MAERPTVAIVIPARMASTRFPGKPLVDLMGKPMIQWVYEACLKSGVANEIAVATPDQEILDACSRFGARAIRTRLDHPSGTDRIAEASASLDSDIYVNVQGDEPLIDPETIRVCAAPLITDETVLMGSICSPCSDEDFVNPAVVKVVLDQKSNALYFSRHPIPFARENRIAPKLRHIGIYAFRRQALLDFTTWRPGSLEQTEALEQLRFLENGMPIRMSLASGSPVSVDTPDQADEVRRILEQR